jgi:hypothetical protein
MEEKLLKAGVTHTVWYDCGFACSHTYYATSLEIDGDQVKIKTLNGRTKILPLERSLVTEFTGQHVPYNGRILGILEDNNND